MSETNEKCRVVHVQRVAGVAGSENHLLLLLPALQEAGFRQEMLVLASAADRPERFVERMRSAGVTTQILPIRGDLDPRLVLRLATHLRRANPFLVHTHLIHGDLYGTLAARLAGVPHVVSSRHNDDDFRRRRPYRPVVRWIAQLAERVLCISENVLRFCRDVEGVPEAKLRLVRYGMDAPGTIPPRLTSDYFGLPTDARVLGMVARLTEQKGHTTVIRAMPRVLEHFPTAHLILVGDGELREPLDRLVRELKIEEKVRFLGYRDDAPELMRGFDIFVHPSRWEGFGMVFLEAMAAEIPVVATRTGSISEIVEEGVTGLLTPVDDSERLGAALCELLADPERALSMGRGGRQRLEEHFTSAAMVERTAAVYREFIG